MKVDYNQKGYVGNKMSQRAVEAYENNEKPLSKWSKEDIIDEIISFLEENINDSNNCFILNNVDALKKLTKQELSYYLTQTSWHHTGKYAQTTYFYSLDEDRIVDNNGNCLITEKAINNIINSREPKEKKVKVVKEPDKFISAVIEYDEWEGKYANYKRKVHHKKVVFYKSSDKMIEIGFQKKRLSSVNVVFAIEQKTKYASKEVVLKKYQKKYNYTDQQIEKMFS